MYAPVLIPTCNRYDKLELLINSLKKCVGAQETELIISVDFPPNEKYTDGYNKLREFLSSPIDGFKKIDIYYQKHNLGPFENNDFLFKNAQSKNYSYAIFMEDDIIPHQGFLKYMNLCLNMFKNNKQVFGIGSDGFLVPDTPYYSPLSKYNTFYTHFGTIHGIFLDRRDYMNEKYINFDYFKTMVSNHKTAKYLKDYSPKYYCQAVNLAFGLDKNLLKKDGSICCIDYVMKLVSVMENMYSIFSINRFIDNIGLDGSGLHAGVGTYEEATPYYESDYQIILQPKGEFDKFEKKLLSEQTYDKKQLVTCEIFVTFYKLFGEKSVYFLNKLFLKLSDVKQKILSFF